MTDHELLELIAHKVTTIDNEVTGIKSSQQRMNNDITEIKSSQQRIDNDIAEIKSSQQRMESKLDLVYNHTANLTEDVTMIKKDIGAVIEVEKSLLEMYGEHEAEIRTLRRRPV